MGNGKRQGVQGLVEPRLAAQSSTEERTKR